MMAQKCKFSLTHMNTEWACNYAIVAVKKKSKESAGYV